MARIRIITDSACDLPAAMAAGHDITMVPLAIRFGSDEFAAGRSLSTDEFWARCATSAALPETSAPSPGAFQDAFAAASSAGYDGVVCLTLSSGVSATYQSARTAADNFDGDIPVQVIDSRSMTMGYGLMLLAASELASKGATLDEITAEVDAMIPNVQVFGAVDTLEHLEKGGRIGGARALLGSLLSIKPVITVIDGAVGEESKQRTRARSLRYLADKAKAAGTIDRIAVCNGAAPDIDVFLDMLGDVHSNHPMIVVDLGPIIGTHTGPGTVGLCLIEAA